MKYCSKCQMKIQNQLHCCPLCGQSLEVLNADEHRDYPECFAKRRRYSLRKLLIFFAIVIIFFSLMSGVFHHVDWSLVAIISVITIYLTTSAILGVRVRRNIGPNLLMQVVGISSIALMIDLFFGYQGWALEFILPVTLAVGTMVITVTIALDSKQFTDLVIYQLIFGLIGVLLLILIYFRFIVLHQFAVFGSYYTILTCVGLFFFADRQMVHELKKKFHY